MKIIKISALWCPACLITNKAIDKIKEEQNIEVENLDATERGDGGFGSTGV